MLQRHACFSAFFSVTFFFSIRYNHLLDLDLCFLTSFFYAVVAVVAAEFCKMLKWVKYPTLTWQTAVAGAPVNIFLCLTVFTFHHSLGRNSLLMVTVFKNVTYIMIIAGDCVFFGSKPDYFLVAAMAASGAVFAAQHDLNITTNGLFWTVANCVSTSGYILYMKFATQHIKMSKVGMVMANNLLDVVLLLPAAYMHGEIGSFLRADAIHTPVYALSILFTGLWDSSLTMLRSVA